MRYMILECRRGYAVALDERGRFLRVANLQYEVGQVVENVVMEKEIPGRAYGRPRHLLRVLTAAACLCILSLGSWQYVFASYGNVRMEINPDVEITVNRLRYAIGLEGLNGEGEALNVWGCRLLRQPWRSGAVWLKAGTFRPSGCFVFDREKIRALLAEAAAQVACCPHFHPDAVARALATLPSQAWPGRRWTLRPPEAGEPGTPLTVRRYRQGCVLHARQAVGGVAPVGDLLARRVIRDARRRGSPV